jgi:phosphoribulokinase
MRQPATITDVLAAIRAAASSTVGRAVVVGVDGPSGAGKSTLARAIAIELGSRLAVIEGDDFYADIDWAVRARFAPAESYSRNFDWQRLHDQVLAPARDGHSSLRYQRYDWDNQLMGDWVEITTPAVLIVEGIYTLRPELRDLMDVRIWVDAGRDVRIARQHARHEAYDRDIAARQNAMMKLWEAAEIHYLETYEPRTAADHLISGESDETH